MKLAILNENVSQGHSVDIILIERVGELACASDGVGHCLCAQVQNFLGAWASETGISEFPQSGNRNEFDVHFGSFYFATSPVALHC